MILPRSGRTAWVRRSRPSFAEPPAEAPSTRKSSRYCGSRSEHSASFAASPSSSTPRLRVSSRALRAASRAWAARTHLSTILRAALARVDVVREREDALLVTVVVLERHLDLGVAFLALEEQHLWVQRGLVLVQVLDELDDAALVQERVAPPVALVLDDDLQAPVQERQLAQPVAERVEREGRLLEDLGVRLEPDDRAGLLAGARRGQGAGGDPVLVALRPLLAVPADLDLEPFAERVHDGDADAVQAAGDLVRGVLELPAGVQNGQDDLGRRLVALLVDVHRDAAAVVADGAGAIGVQDDLDAVAVAGQRLVDRVVDGLVHEVVQAVRARVAD